MCRTLLVGLTGTLSEQPLIGLAHSPSAGRLPDTAGPRPALLLPPKNALGAGLPLGDFWLDLRRQQPRHLNRLPLVMACRRPRTVGLQFAGDADQGADTAGLSGADDGACPLGVT